MTNRLPIYRRRHGQYIRSFHCTNLGEYEPLILRFNDGDVSRTTYSLMRQRQVTAVRGLMSLASGWLTTAMILMCGVLSAVAPPISSISAATYGTAATLVYGWLASIWLLVCFRRPVRAAGGRQIRVRLPLWLAFFVLTLALPAFVFAVLASGVLEAALKLIMILLFFIIGTAGLGTFAGLFLMTDFGHETLLEYVLAIEDVG